MKGDTICIDRFVQHCLDNQTPQQRWINHVMNKSNDHRVVGQFPSVKISEGFGLTTYGYHAGGGVHTMPTREWETYPVYQRRQR